MQVIDKALDVLEAVASMGGMSLPQIQQHCGLSMTTAHRITQALIQRGFIIKIGRGSYRIGTGVIGLAERQSLRNLLGLVARPHVILLSRRLQSHAHLGVLEDHMVTYLIKQRYGRTRLHSAEGMQLEAYCSALGKVLLAGCSDDGLRRYAAEGDFVALTDSTIIDPATLLAEVHEVRNQGWACDREEISPGLWCVAVPVLDRRGEVLAAISVSKVSGTPIEVDASFLDPLLDTARAVRQALFPGA